NIFYSAVALTVIKERKVVTLIQQLSNGLKNIVTGNPVFDNDGNIIRVVTNARNINNLFSEEDQSAKGDREQYRRKYTNHMISEDFVAKSESMREVVELCKRIAKVDSAVLVQGESGVGKEVIVRYIHSISNRSKGPLVAINCGAIPETLLESELFGYEMGAFTSARSKGKMGLIEEANKGTLLLDEISEMPLNLQVKLLRVLDQKKFTRVGGTRSTNLDVRVIAASNRNLKDLVDQKLFRDDLYYRLKVVPVNVPPLRNRKEDIRYLADYFLGHFTQKYKTLKVIDESVYCYFESYHWPGNIRELKNLIERLVVTTDRMLIKTDDLETEMNDMFMFELPLDNQEQPKCLKELVDEFEKGIIIRMYDKYQNSYEVARELNISQSSASRKIRKYTLEI
ncbi:MAG: sigma 54-interacting transcriptional regulator, partial [Bacillota bacterium]|nr:sigma 54-interacting transcriptional regulator [Bacillota bacterium]